MQSVETITHKVDIPNECPPALPEWAPDAGDGQFFLNGWVEDW
ncbi:hypothetical protein [Gordonia alkaliphila]|nr:hypothetical protein [Gordonia alkaliphila]